MKTYYTHIDPFFDFIFPFKEGDNLKADIIEREHDYLIKMNVPGVKKEDLKITLKDGYLTINVENKEALQEGERYLHQERHTGTSTRRFSIDVDVKKEDISASVEDGVLNLVIKKRDVGEKEEEQDITID